RARHAARLDDPADREAGRSGSEQEHAGAAARESLDVLHHPVRPALAQRRRVRLEPLLRITDQTAQVTSLLDPAFDERLHLPCPCLEARSQLLAPLLAFSVQRLACLRPPLTELI